MLPFPSGDQRTLTNNNKSFMSVVELTLNPPEGIVAGPITEDNFFEWEALIA